MTKPDKILPNDNRKYIREFDHTSIRLLKFGISNKDHKILGDTMDPHDKDLSTESYEHIRKFALKPDTDSIGSKVNDYTMSDQVLEDLIDKTSSEYNNHSRPTRLYNYEAGVSAHPIYQTYKYEYFGKTTEMYPIFFEWILKRTADVENFKDKNKVTEQDILLLANKNDENRNSADPKLSSASSESIIRKECPTPCVRELICPKLPPCPPESSGGGSSGLDGSRGLGGFGGAGGFSGQGSNPLRDPDNVQLQCSTRNINFKLKCSRLPPNCDFPEGTYECEIVNEGKYVDSKDLEACDLKCREIHAVHSDHGITIKETEDSQAPIIVKKVDNTQEENRPPKNVTNIMCSKNDVNFTLERPSTTSDTIYPSDILFICNIREQETSSGEIFSTPLKCKQIHNLIDDTELDRESYNDNIQLLTNDQHSFTPIDLKDECPEKKLESYNRVEEKAPAFPISHDVDDINEEQLHSKLKINIVKREKSNSNLNKSVDFICPKKDEDSASVFEKLQSSFIENHNKTVQILKIATNDLLCRITNKNPCCRRSCDNNKLECLDAATESCHKLLESVCVTTKALSKFTRETIDSYIGSQEESNQKSEDPPNCELRKTSGEPPPEDFIKVINGSAKEIINDIAYQNIFEDEKPPPNQLETIKNSATKIFNNIIKITADEFDTVKTINSIKETCINLIDKASTILSGNTSDSPSKNEPSTAQGYVKDVRTGIIVFQDENKTETRPEENMLSQDWTDSLHSVLSSLSTTFKEPSDSSVNNSAWKKRYLSENNEPFTLYSMFATLRDKICSIFHDSQSESTYSTSSSVLSEQADDDHMN